MQPNGRYKASLYHKSVRVEWKTRSQSPCTPLNAFGIPSGPGAVFFLCSQHLITILLVDNRNREWSRTHRAVHHRYVLQRYRVSKPDTSSSTSGLPSSSVTAWRQSIGFLETHARKLHLARAVSFSFCVLDCVLPPPVQQCSHV